MFNFQEAFGIQLASYTDAYRVYTKNAFQLRGRVGAGAWSVISADQYKVLPKMGLVVKRKTDDADADVIWDYDDYDSTYSLKEIATGNITTYTNEAQADADYLGIELNPINSDSGALNTDITPSDGITAEQIDSIIAEQITGSITASQIGSVNATAITGTITAGQIGSVNASVITGSITASQIGSVNASVISGLISASQIDTITAGQITGSITASQIGSVNATAITGSITASQIGSVNATAISGLISSSQINSVTAGQITGSIVASQIGSVNATAITGTITGAQIGSSTITGSNIAAATITASNIANGTITATQIEDLTITASEIANLTITAGQIANATITGAKITSATITGSLIAAATIAGSNIAGGTITGSNIAGATITGANIVAATITGSLIANATITGSNIAATTITAGNIAAGTITTTQIAAGTITGSNIAATTITASNIAADTITAAQIAAGTITSSELAANCVTATQINAGAVTAAKISVSQLSAIAADMGSITAGTITGAVIRTASSGARTEINSSNLFALGFGGIGGTDGTTTQWYAKNSDGKIYAGGGNLVVSANGLDLGYAVASSSAIKFSIGAPVPASAPRIAVHGQNFVGSPGNHVGALLKIQTFYQDATNKDSEIYLSAAGSGVSAALSLVGSGTDSTAWVTVKGDFAMYEDNTYDIGVANAVSLRPRNMYVAGTVAIGTTSTANGKLRVAGQIVPDDDTSYNLGSDTLRWKVVYTGKSGAIDFESSSTSRTTTNLSTGRLYIKGNKLIVHYRTSTNQARYFYIDLTLTSNPTWTYSATEP